MISKEDPDWWQGRLWNESQKKELRPAGLMPSPKMQETRTVCIAMERAKQEQGGGGGGLLATLSCASLFALGETSFLRFVLYHTGR